MLALNQSNPENDKEMRSVGHEISERKRGNWDWNIRIRKMKSFLQGYLSLVSVSTLDCTEMFFIVENLTRITWISIKISGIAQLLKSSIFWDEQLSVFQKRRDAHPLNIPDESFRSNTTCILVI